MRLRRVVERIGEYPCRKRYERLERRSSKRERRRKRPWKKRDGSKRKKCKRPPHHGVEVAIENAPENVLPVSRTTTHVIEKMFNAG